MLRVIAGTAKKRQLKVPKGLDVRPTSDRVKEALFNILGSFIPGCRFLDLFAGTGNVGIEALSRGAGSAVFVEINRRNIRIIKENLAATGLESKARLLNLDACDALSLLGREGQTFDIVFLDPPYLKNFEYDILAGIAGYSLLEPGGKVIIESSKKDRLPLEIEGLKVIRQERYGDTMLSFYNNEPAAREGNEFADRNMPGEF
ncbi:MAG: 16S rRNA (guanine(966)-N(2))-methyltransferase RsmD [Firmicutes bacterium]|nr:16S rRNA (guanine(966)-N(2))-methyltransferase RsmD [Bacillota bacterium]